MKSNLGIKIFKVPEDRGRIEKFLSRGAAWQSGVEEAVGKIIEDVRKRGDRAVADLTSKFDKVQIKPSEFAVSSADLKRAWEQTPADLKRAIKTAASRIRKFHRRQLPGTWEIKENNGSRLTQRYLPIRRVGVYIPGGLAPLSSTALMTIIPAQIAGVEQIALTSPPDRDGLPNQTIMAIAHFLGITEVYRMGGAQAVAALALGTKTIPSVDLIAGPGNKYVATAKKILFGAIGIDSVAGPTDVTIVADDSAPPAWIAADMLAQAEHDPDATAIAILIGKVNEKTIMKELMDQTEAAPRKEIIKKSLKGNGAIIKVRSREEAVEFVNLKSPEHLEVMTRNPRPLAEKMTGAAAVFVGRWSAEAVGDYVAGPNHTLPTERTARFFSPLGVMDFMRGQHLVEMSRDGVRSIADAGIILAESEQLFAHAESLRKRK